jgi:diguanylate cyclase (GGDEF)-like protein/PAS domain S-box-containing protein
MILLIIIIVNLLPINSAYAIEKVTLQLKWNHQVQFAGFYAAKKLGYYKDVGLDVEIRELEEGRSSADIVLQGDAQYGLIDSSIVLSRLSGKPLVALAAIYQHSPLVLIALESSGIISPLELKNKRVMYQKNTDDAVLLAMFTELGIKDSDFNHFPHDFTDDALLRDVDAMSAYITDQPFYYESQNHPINIISPVSYGIDFYGDILFTEENYLKENKQQVLAFRKASLKGWDYAIHNQEEMVDWILENYETNKSKEHLLFEAEKIYRLIQPELVELGYFHINRFNRIADIYTKLGHVQNNGDLSGLNYQEYYQNEFDSDFWYNFIKVLSLICILVAISLALLNSRLKSQVNIRTKELEIANTTMLKHIKLINNYVITCSLNNDGIFTKVSDAFCKISGYEKEELIGHHVSALDHPEFTEIYREIWLKLNNGQVWSGDIKNTSKSGNEYWIHSKIEPIYDENSKPIGCTAVSEDITNKKRVEVMSMTDSLTGLSNRRHIDKTFVQVIAQAERHHRPLSILMLDFDNFKTVNDNFGHLVGDRVLKSISNLIMENVRQSDIVGRWGGEELILICPDTKLKQAITIAETLRVRILNHNLSDNIGNITCSFGVAQWQNGEAVEHLVSRADKALYSAKNNGRDRVEVS